MLLSQAHAPPIYYSFLSSLFGVARELLLLLLSVIAAAAAATMATVRCACATRPASVRVRSRVRLGRRRRPERERASERAEGMGEGSVHRFGHTSSSSIIMTAPATIMATMKHFSLALITNRLLSLLFPVLETLRVELSHSDGVEFL